jgi:hypothetical protein
MEVVPVKTPELMGNEDMVQRPNLLGNLSGQPVLALITGPVQYPRVLQHVPQDLRID